MGIQFGKWEFSGVAPAVEYLTGVQAILDSYSSDNNGTWANESVVIGHRAFHTTRESTMEKQPHSTGCCTVTTWDGRLDNRQELIRELGNALPTDSSDLAIVSTAYERWGIDSFSKLVGDWALCVWLPREMTLILAKDVIGTRQLYYFLTKNGISWCTILDPLVRLAGRPFQLDEEFIAGWFSSFPAAHLTPYVGIHAVPPSSFVLIRAGQCLIRKYWDFSPEEKIRYRSDREYEEHFRAVFAEAVRRRLRTAGPILAELSGGLDSSSIVCMADSLIARAPTCAQRLETLSYHDDSEPNWNELPYVTKIEERRGRVGVHIDIGSEDALNFHVENGRFPATPAYLGSFSGMQQQFMSTLKEHGYRVVLSGIGGDEILGGVPTPIPELADLIATGHFLLLARQLKLWSLSKRKPWFHVLFETLNEFLPAPLAYVPKYKHPAGWLNQDFVRRQRASLLGSETHLGLFGRLPSFQENLNTLEILRRQIAFCSQPSVVPYEKRYPYLDRDLLRFIYAIPRDQLVRPGQRRSLMRRALAGIVPDETLTRPRKAYVARRPLALLASKRAELLERTDALLITRFNIVEPLRLDQALGDASRGIEVPLVPLIRTLAVEAWLQAVCAWSSLNTPTAAPTLHDLRISAGRRDLTAVG